MDRLHSVDLGAHLLLDGPLTIVQIGSSTILGNSTRRDLVLELLPALLTNASRPDLENIGRC